MTDTLQKRFRMPKMEGAMARWYARQRGSANQRETYRKQAAQLTRGLSDGADVLEVAPGPGYLAIEIAQLGRFHVTGLDISRTFVDIATQIAGQEKVQVDFRHGDVESMPFESDTFDLIVCQAAFKNFGRPVVAINEMHRVLRPGGRAVIQDLSRDASAADIAEEVRRMQTGRVNGFVIRRTLAGLRLRAATRDRLQGLAAASAFGGGEILVDTITMEVRLNKRVAAAPNGGS